MTAPFRLTIDPEGIARMVFDLPDESVNKLSVPVLEELDSLLEGLKDNQHVKALVITSAKEGVFIAGADLKSFKSYFKDPNMAEDTISMGHRIFNKLSDLPFPSIAVINGACLGGGLELALACTYRIVGDHEKTSLGLPETNLGLFPGWGGTQRLPRLVGFTQGLTMILTGKQVDAKKAFKINLADAIFASEFLEEKTKEFISECLSDKGRKHILQRRKQKGVYSLLFDRNFIGRSIVCWKAKKDVLKKTKGFYPAPVAAIEVVKNTYAMPLKKGLKKEIEYFVKSIRNGDFRHVNNLIQIFFNQEEMKKDPGLPETSNETPEVLSIGVLGAGTMGSGIAWLSSYRDIPVRMKDVDWKAVGKGYQSAWDTYKVLMKKRKLRPTQANVKFHKIAGTTDYQGFQNLDLIIEAATENLKLKHKIFEEVEAAVDADTIIATNTSSFTIQELSKTFKHPERLVGMHFFNPPGRMPLVEVVAGEKTAPEVVHAAVDLCKKLKKTPIVVGDCSGFLVNRVFVRGFSEVLRMLEEGIEMKRLDKVLLNFGMPMGPFVLADEVGNDVNLKVFESLEKAYGDRIKVPDILKAVNEKELYGKKVGKGFYIHKNKERKPNPEIQELLGERPSPPKMDDEEIVERLTLAMINEASRCLEEGVVSKPSQVDIAMVFGTGFPPFRGGLLKYADSLGIETVVSKMKKLQMIHGERYAPTDQLLDMEKRNKSFY